MATVQKLDAVKYERCEIEGYSPFETRGDCWYDAEIAQAAIDFFPQFLQHIKGPLAGKPMELAEWQKKIIATLFGWKRPDGTRRYRTAYIEVPRKAGKSTMSAGIALLMLYLDDEPGAEIYSCAGDTDQAAIVFELAKENVMRNPALDECSVCYRRSIIYNDEMTGLPKGAYKVVSADAKKKHGYNPHGVIFDELHTQPNDELWEAMKTGMGARTQPLMVAITTAGHDRNSICYEQYSLACQVRDGIIENQGFLPAIYEATAEDDWTDPKTWYKAQPNLGESVPESFYRDECELAKQSPRYENSFRRLYLDQWTEQAVRWLNMERWDLCGGALRTIGSRGCYGGLDLSSVIDLTAFVLVSRDSDGTFDVVPTFWVPEETMRQKSHDDKVRYDVWKKQGFLKTTPGARIDYDYVVRDIVELGKQYNITGINYDRWGAEKIRTDLGNAGFEVSEFGQGFASFSSPTKALESFVVDGKIRHAAHPVLRWNASNAVVDTDPAENIKPTKDPKKCSGRIDGIIGLIMGLAGAMVGMEASVYETRGLASISQDADTPQASQPDVPDAFTVPDWFNDDD
jgi:phage terminase large subunit-like protein